MSGTGESSVHASNGSLSTVESAVDSFWEIGHYKRTVQRIEHGDRQCNEMIKFVQERAEVEELYCRKLREWQLRWSRNLEKSSEYNTALLSWKSMLNEAEHMGNHHMSIKDSLHAEMENIKNFKKENYHKLMLGGYKETKELESEFQKAQKPWAKLLKKCNEAKKNYYNMCKDERLAQAHENAAKSQDAPEKIKKLQEVVEKKGIDREMLKSKYEQAVTDISAYNPLYQQEMKQVFEKSQQSERHRQLFVKNTWTNFHRAIDTSDSPKMKTIYKQMKEDINAADSESDLIYWEDWHGPAMAMNWPTFEEYNPEGQKTKRKAVRRSDEKGVDSKKEVFRLNKNGDTGDRAEQSVASSVTIPDWSDDDDEGLPVRALYDYAGQEQDEISFQAGDTLWKLTEEDEQGWSRGRLTDGTVGLYPANYVSTI